MLSRKELMSLRQKRLIFRKIKKFSQWKTVESRKKIFIQKVRLQQVWIIYQLKEALLICINKKLML